MIIIKTVEDALMFLSHKPSLLLLVLTLLLAACGSGGGSGGGGGTLALSGLTYSTSSASYTINVAITANTPSNSVGTVVSYAVSPALPTGISLNTSTGEITGTPTAITSTANYTVTATNAVGSTNVTVSITVNDIAPIGLTYTDGFPSYITTNVITPNTTSSGGGTVVSYAVSPALPTGLSLDVNTGEITGTPTVSTSAIDYTITATNTGGSTNAIVNITIILSAPTGLSYTNASATYLTSFAITANTPSNTGGPVESYEVSPALPTGLSLDTTTGEITGTPTVVTSTIDYTVSATNAGGSSGATISITVGSPSPRFAYVTNKGGNISIYAIDASTGQLRARGYTPSVQFDSITIAPSGQFAYATNTAPFIFIYSINASTGALTAEGSVATGTSPSSVTIDPTGQFAYVANSGSDNVSVYTINASTGVLTPGVAVDTGTNPSAVTVDPSGQFAYVVNFGSNNVSAYRINASTGALTEVGNTEPIQREPTQREPTAITIEPTGQFAYVVNGYDNSVSMYSIDSSSGALSLLSSIGAGITPVSITIDPSGQFAYVANSSIQSNTVSIYSGVSTGVLVLEDTVLPGVSPEFVSFDPSGQFAYVVNKGSSYLTIYNVNASTGLLTPLAASSKMITGNSPTSIAISKGVTSLSYVPKFAYVANHLSNNISAYSINADTGALTLENLVNLGNGSTGPLFVAVDPAGEFAYVLSQVSGANGTITIFSIDATTGGLTFVATEVIQDTELNSVAIDPSGRFIYYPTPASFSLSNTSINPGIGTFGVGGAASTGSDDPRFVAIDPSGRFAYTTNTVGTNITAFTINSSTGNLTQTGSQGASSSPIAMAIAPSGQFAYVIDPSDDYIKFFRINSSTGEMSSIGTDITGTIDTGNNPRSIAIDPSGQFVYVVDFDDDDVRIYRINSSDGTLTQTGVIELADSSKSDSITVDPSGQFVYVTSFSNNNVSLFKINAINGGLTEVGSPVPTDDGPEYIFTLGGLIDVDIKKKYQIGDTGPAGGIVFYVTALGDHGLEAAPEDLIDGATAEWGCIDTLITGAEDLKIGSGAQNTSDILAECSELGIAAKLADDYSLNGFDDWFLPSGDELNQMHENKDVVSGFASSFYWSSSKFNSSSSSWAQSFDKGSQSSSSRLNTFRVRAVRAF
jgi:6-phosphogluconolactonase (cycloisomerase 2 family)